MSMSDEKFETAMEYLDGNCHSSLAYSLRARDTAQREAIERLQGELDEYISSVPGIEYERDNLREALARVEAERDFLSRDGESTRLHANHLQAQLAEADALLTNVMNCTSFREIGEVEMAIAAYFARHDQAEQQEALSEAELMDVAMFVGSGNKAARRANALGAAELPEHLAPNQEAQGAQAGDEHENFEAWHRRVVAGEPPHEKYHDGSYVNQHVNRYWTGWSARAALATQPAEQWIACSDRLPVVPEGDQRTFLVSVLRGRYGESFVFEAHYLQDYPLYNEALGDEEGEYPATGWFVQVPDVEYEEYYEPVVSKLSADRVTHWMPLPKPAAVRGAEHE